MPGITMSMKMRSGCISFASRTPSWPSEAVAVWKPPFSSAFFITCTSVGESSTMSIRATFLSPNVRLDRTEQFFLGERLGQVVLRADDAAAGTIEQAILGRKHDHRNGAKHLVVLDQRTGLIAVEARHHDVHEDDVGLVVGDLGQRIEAIDGREDLAALLRQQRFRRAPDGLAVVDYEYLQTLEVRVLVAHRSLTPGGRNLACGTAVF